MLFKLGHYQIFFVFAVCAQGTFGMNCAKRCRCEDGVLCDHVTGACQRDCPVGYRGENCTQGIHTSLNVYISFF